MTKAKLIEEMKSTKGWDKRMDSYKKHGILTTEQCVLLKLRHRLQKHDNNEFNKKLIQDIDQKLEELG